MPTSWWVQFYEGDGTEHGYRLVPEKDREFAFPVNALLYIRKLLGDDFIRDQWEFLVSEGDMIAWVNDVYGVTMVTEPDVPVGTQKEANET
jgi:hypothetical protein